MCKGEFQNNLHKNSNFRNHKFLEINFEINQRTMAVVIKYAQTQKDHIIADVKRVIIWPMMSTHVLMLTSVTATVTIQK